MKKRCCKGLSQRGTPHDGTITQRRMTRLSLTAERKKSNPASADPFTTFPCRHHDPRAVYVSPRVLRNCIPVAHRKALGPLAHVG